MEQKLITLLVDCLHQDAHQMTAERLTALTGEEWCSLLTLASEHKVRGLLYHRLRSRGLASAIPSETLRALRSIYRRNAADNLGFFGELNRIATAFQSQGIPVIVLKGAYLAGVVYQNLAAREMVDVDLLVPAGVVWQAAKILEEQGYEPENRYRIDTELVTGCHLPTFTKPHTAAIELHWNIVPPGLSSRGDVGELWERAAPVHLADVPVLGLSAEDLLLHLCIHASFNHEFGNGLRPLCDIAEAICHYGSALEWRQLVQRARRYRWERGIYLALRLAKELVGAAVPAGVLEDLRPAAFDEIMTDVARKCLFADMQDRKLAEAMSLSVVRWWRTTGLAGKARAFWRGIFVPKTHLSLEYAVSPDSPTIYLFYLARLKNRLFWHWRIALDLHRGDPRVSSVAQRKVTLQNWLAEHEG